LKNLASPNSTHHPTDASREDGESKNFFVIRLRFENGKKFFMQGSLPPDGSIKTSRKEACRRNFAL